MTASKAKVTGPDFSLGLPLREAPNQCVVSGHVRGDPVLLSRLGGQYYAVGGVCTHYGGALADGLVVGDSVRCPLHHACFSLRTGEAVSAPAFDRLDQWMVEVSGDMLFVRERLSASQSAPKRARAAGEPKAIVIVGGGAAGFAAAEMLRRRGYEGRLTILSADSSAPCDRPNLSKDYLAGTAPEAWIPLKGEEFYHDHAIDLRLDARVAKIDPEARRVTTAAGENFAFDRLLLATGAEPVRLVTPGFDSANVHTLRSLGDARAIIDAAIGGKSVAIIGASFIGLEAAAALRARGMTVQVVAPEPIPMQRVLGSELGAFVGDLHVEKGVVFYLGETVKSFDGTRLRLAGGGEIAADLVVLGVGVKPRLELAAAAALALSGGVAVDEFLQTSQPGIFAAGDIAAYPDPWTGERIRVEHWVAAQRQGQVAAANMLGARDPFNHAPFFWSNHYDLAIRYVGHAPSYDAIEVDGSIAAGDATVRFKRGGQLLAAASVGRELENLAIEAEMEAALSTADPPSLGVSAVESA